MKYSFWTKLNQPLHPIKFCTFIHFHQFHCIWMVLSSNTNPQLLLQMRKLWGFFSLSVCLFLLCFGFLPIAIFLLIFFFFPCSQKTLLSSDAYWEHTEICMVHAHAAEQSSLYSKWGSTVLCSRQHFKVTSLKKSFILQKK